MATGFRQLDVTDWARSLGSVTQPQHAGGAYGLRVHGIEVPSNQLVDAPAAWQSVEVRVRLTTDPQPPAEYINGETACLGVRAGGSVVLDRGSGRATFTLAERPTASALVHPHLAAVAAVWAHWSGREGFHAGAFLAAGGVWGLLGDKGAGKSSTLAALARMEVPVLCDDVLVLEGSTALAGPRSIDLRADAAHSLGVGEPLGIVGDRERWRIPLAPIAPELPFRGWVTLRWAEEPRIRPLRGAERMRELLAHRALRVPPRTPAALFDLGDRPFFEFSRPRRWGSIDDALKLLLASLSG